MGFYGVTHTRQTHTHSYTHTCTHAHHSANRQQNFLLIALTTKERTHAPQSAAVSCPGLSSSSMKRRQRGNTSRRFSGPRRYTTRSRPPPPPFTPPPAPATPARRTSPPGSTPGGRPPPPCLRSARPPAHSTATAWCRPAPCPLWRARTRRWPRPGAATASATGLTPAGPRSCGRAAGRSAGGPGP